MSGGLKWRMALIATVVVVGLLYSAPTFFALPGWWTDNFPDEKISLGLDLQGGVHLLLEVESEKAVANSLERLAGDLKDVLFSESIPFQRVEVDEEDRLVVEILDGAAKERLDRILDTQLQVLEKVKVSEAEEGVVVMLAYEGREADAIRRLAIDQALETIRNRIDQFGVSEPSIQRQGEEQILVQLPGVKDPKRAIDLIGKTALLEFKLVNDEYNLDDALEGNIPPGNEVLYQRHENRETGEVTKRPFLVRRRTLLTGQYLTNAVVRIDNQFNEPYVAIDFNPRGGKIFERVTKANVKKRLAIILDDNVYSAPVIQEKISGGSARITGRFTMEEARDLSIVLRAGSLPAPVKILENRTVGPSLGQDSINQGIRSIIVGAVCVTLFIILYYHLAGLVADFALTLNILIIVAALAGFGATLTLPGMAGVLLTIGMAIDANVLIFERTREELRSGKTPRAAIDGGYSKALLTILDANITTLIAAVFLFQFGTGPIKGFAVTLSIGIIASLFTSIVVTRTVFNFFLQRRRVRKLSI
jgi:preprotein translocase subunit SecD